MPDTRLTWPRFREHLRKYGWIYLVGIAAVYKGVVQRDDAALSRRMKALLTPQSRFNDGFRFSL